MEPRPLAGEIAMAQKDLGGAVEELQAGIAIQDAMPYAEPPPFYVPLRQVLGRVLLESRRPAAAEAAFREDLQHFPNNGWSLYGLARSLEAQGKRTEASWAEEGFRNAWARVEPDRKPFRF